MTKSSSRALDFIHSEAAGGVFLLLAAILALLIANSSLASLYSTVLDAKLGLGISPLRLEKTVLHWINDGLMAIFFLLVGLEIKRELLQGELSSVRKASLPVAAAIGGMACPALIYLVINRDNPSGIGGWAIPSATDIAFAVGMLALLGSRIPPALRIFLLALAIIDDLGAIIVIALFYTADLSVVSLALAAVGLVVLAVMNSRGVDRLWPYMLVGAFVWLCVLKSGVHATLAGVATAFAIPLAAGENDDGPSLASSLMHQLHPWVSFLIVPLFAFANAGVSLIDATADDVWGPVPLGIALGLLIGKPLGVVLCSWLATASGAASLPDGVRWSHILGAGLFAGIGFTMSLFIGSLAFPDASSAAAVRIGVLGGSLLAATIGFIFLTITTRPATTQQPGH